MDSEIVYLALAALAFAVALNLKLTLSVLRASRRERDIPPSLVPGQQIPPVLARSMSNGVAVQLAAPGQAFALIFLSSRCSQCHGKLAELERMAPAAADAGLALWIVSEEPAWRLRAFMRGTSLPSLTVRVSASDYRALNASLTSPAYLFVNHEAIIEAAGLIGDENWLALAEQLGVGGLEAAA